MSQLWAGRGGCLFFSVGCCEKWKSHCFLQLPYWFLTQTFSHFAVPCGSQFQSLYGFHWVHRLLLVHPHQVFRFHIPALSSRLPAHLPSSFSMYYRSVLQVLCFLQGEVCTLSPILLVVFGWFLRGEEGRSIFPLSSWKLEGCLRIVKALFHWLPVSSAANKKNHAVIIVL